MIAQSRSRPKHDQCVSQLFPHYIYQIADFREWVMPAYNLWWPLETLAWVQNQDSGREIYILYFNKKIKFKVSQRYFILMNHWVLLFMETFNHGPKDGRPRGEMEARVDMFKSVVSFLLYKSVFKCIHYKSLFIIKCLTAACCLSIFYVFYINTWFSILSDSCTGESGPLAWRSVPCSAPCRHRFKTCHCSLSLLHIISRAGSRYYHPA